MLEGLKIGGIEGIGGFGGIKPNSQLTPKVPETQQYATPIETTSTPRIDAIGQPQMMSSATGGKIGGFADTSTMLDRQIEDQKKKFITPKLDFMKGFGGIDGITRPAINPAITTDKFAKGFGEEFRAEPEKFQDSFVQNLLGKQTELGQQANKLVADKFQAQQLEGKAKIESDKKESELVKKIMSGEIQDRELIAQEYPEFADKIDTYMELSNNLGSIKNIKEFEKKYPDVSKKVWYDNNKRTFDKGTTIFDVEAVKDSPLTQLEQEQAIQAKEAGYEMEDIQKEIAKQRTKIDIMEKAVGKKADGLINDMGDSLGLTDVEQIRGTKEYYDELKNLYERETKSPYVEPWMKSRSFMDLTPEQQEVIKDEPQMEGILKFGNILRQGLAFGVNLGPAAINLAIFVNELVQDPKGTVSQFKQIPEVLSNYINESLDNIDQKAAEGGAIGALEGVLEVIDDTQMFLAENPDIILAPEAMLTKGSAIKALTKLGIDNIGEIAKKINISIPEGEAAVASAKLDAKTLNLIDKSIKPTVAGKQSAADLAKFQENVVKSVDTIIQNKDNLKFTDDLGQTIEGKTPESLQQFSESIGQTKDSIFQQYNSLAKEAGKTVDVPLDNIVKELDGIINNQLLDISAPGLRKYAESMKKTVAKINKLGVEQSQQLLQQLNAKLKAFYRNPNPNDIGKNMVDVLISNNLRQGLDDSILKALGDNQYSNLKSKYGELVSIEKEVAKRALIEARRNNKSLLDFTDIFSAGDVIGGLAGGQFGLVAKGLIQKGIKEYFKFLNNPNNNIKKLFKKVEEGKIDVESLRKTKNIKKAETTLEKAKDVKLEKPKEPGLSNLGKTKNKVIPDNKAMIKAPKTKTNSLDKTKLENIKLKKNEYIRYSNDVNLNTDNIRGGTWYTNKEGADVVVDAMNPSMVKEISIGGNNITKKTIKPKNPLIIKDAILDEGALNIINAGYEDFIDIRYSSTLDDLYNNISDVNPKDVNKTLQNALFNVGIDSKQVKNILKLSEKNKYDATIDAIVSKGLKEQGYDALVLKSGDGEHIFNLGSIETKSEGLSNLGKTKPKTMDARIPEQRVMVKAPEDSLYAEARKYKSAEEFVKANNPIKSSIQPKKEIANKYQQYIDGDVLYIEGMFANDLIKGKGITKDIFLKKIKDFKNKNGQFKNDYDVARKFKFDVGSTNTIGFTNFYPEGKIFVDKLVGEGYLKEIFSEKGGQSLYKITNKIDDYVPKSQLKQIREEANKKGLKPNSEGLTNLGKTDFKKPETTGLPEVKSNIKKAFEKLSDDEIEILGELIHDKTHLGTKVGEKVDLLEEIFKKISEENNVELYRGVTKNEFENFMKGKDKKRYISFSEDIDTAKDFADDGKYLIKIDKKSKGLNYWETEIKILEDLKKKDLAEFESIDGDFMIESLMEEKEWLFTNDNIKNLKFSDDGGKTWKKLSDDGLAGLGKTDFKKPVTTGLPKSVKLNYNKSNNPKELKLEVYKGKRGYKTLDTAGSKDTSYFYTDNPQRALGFDNNIKNLSDMKKEIITIPANKVKIIDSSKAKWSSKVDKDGNIIKGISKEGTDNYIDYNNKLARQEGYDAVIYQNITDIGPIGNKNLGGKKPDLGGDDIVLL